MAGEILKQAASTLAELSLIVEIIRTLVDSAPTGRKVRDSKVREKLYRHLIKALRSETVKLGLSVPVRDVDLSVAIGTTILNLQTREREDVACN
jgi:hypothetical protein